MSDLQQILCGNGIFVGLFEMSRISNIIVETKSGGWWCVAIIEQMWFVPVAPVVFCVYSSGTPSLKH